MKTETQIAEENIKVWKERIDKRTMEMACREHKASCQRFLEFLEETFGKDLDIEEEFDTIIHKKIQDLKQAIKLYNEAGI